MMFEIIRVEVGALAQTVEEQGAQSGEMFGNVVAMTVCIGAHTISRP